MKVIECNGLKKSFKQKEVLKGIDLNVSEGEILGVLGKNGAGKTTLNRIFAGFSFPSFGEIKILGKIPRCGNGKIGILSENISIYPTLTAKENIAQIYLINNVRPDKHNINKILNLVSIENNKAKANKFSLGMKRRLQIAMSILTIERDILILDEPTNGLDINGLLWFKDLLIQLKKEGKTVIMSSHAIRELENILTSYAIISDGKIKTAGEMKEIKNTYMLVSFENESINLVSDLFKQKKIEYQLEGNKFRIENDDTSFKNDFLQILAKEHLKPLDFSLHKKSLVDLFLSNTGDQNV